MVYSGAEPWALLVQTPDDRCYLFPAAVADVTTEIPGMVPLQAVDAGLGVEITGMLRLTPAEIDQRVAWLREQTGIPSQRWNLAEDPAEE